MLGESRSARTEAIRHCAPSFFITNSIDVVRAIIMDPYCVFVHSTSATCDVINRIERIVIRGDVISDSGSS